MALSTEKTPSTAPTPSSIELLETSGAAGVVVSGDSFILTATYTRQGDDLLLTGEGGREVLIRDYFACDAPPDLLTETGARVTGATAEILAGPLAPGQLAQAGGQLAQAAVPIGRVQVIDGPATATRSDGTTVTLTQGSSVYQGDVVQTGAGTQLGLVFIDKTTLSMGDNARMILNELVYNPAGGPQSSVMTMLQGLFVFVSGEIGKLSPDAVTFNTPVATIGIRGTKGVIAEFTQAGGDLKVGCLNGLVTARTAIGDAVALPPGTSTTITSPTLPPLPPSPDPGFLTAPATTRVDGTSKQLDPFSKDPGRRDNYGTGQNNQGDGQGQDGQQPGDGAPSGVPGGLDLTPPNLPDLPPPPPLAPPPPPPPAGGSAPRGQDGGGQQGRRTVGPEPEANGQQTATRIDGEAVDGPIAGASVFADANNDGILQAGQEPNTRTDGTGGFALDLPTGLSGPLYLKGGVDISTRLPNQFGLSAPEGSTVITPVTTLIQTLVAQGRSAADAEAAIKAALGIAQGVQITRFDALGVLDPNDAITGDVAIAKTVYAIQTEVGNSFVMMASLLRGAGVEATGAADAVARALALGIETRAGQGLPFDLADKALLKSVIEIAAREAGAPLAGNDEIIGAAAEVIACINQKIEDIDHATVGTLDLLLTVAKVGQVGQGAGSIEFSEAGEAFLGPAANPATIANDLKAEFNDANLAARIDAAVPGHLFRPPDGTPPPVLVDANGAEKAGLDTSATFVQNDGPVAITDITLTVIDPDDSTIDSAKIVLTNQLNLGKESLSAQTDGTNIAQTYDAASGTLTLTGTDSVANYQKVLRTVAYENSSVIPVKAGRIIEITADSDSTPISTPAIATVNVSGSGLLFENLTISENAANGTVVGKVLLDGQDPLKTLSYAVTGGNAAGVFTVDAATGEISVADNSPLDYETPRTFTLQVKLSESQSVSTTQTLNIAVTDVNEAPTAIALDNVTVAENAPGAAIGTLTVSDPDAGDSHSLTVDDARFEVVAGQLRLKAGESLDHESEPTVTVNVTATDQGGLAFSRSFALAVTDGNEAPTAIALDNATVAENAPGAIIGTLAVSDPDAGDSHIFAVDDARFEVVAGQLRLKAGESLDHESEPTVTVNVTATDQGGLDFTQGFDIAVTDVNETPEINVVYGTLGDDAIDGTEGDDVIFAFLGKDTVDGLDGDDVIYGGAGDDSIDGGAGDDVLFSGDGRDTLSGGTGDDQLIGNGDTLASYESATAEVTVNLSGQDGGGKGSAVGGAGIDTLEGIRAVRGTDYDDTIIGDSGANLLTGGAGSDTLDGGAGADTLIIEGVSDGQFIEENRLRGAGETGDLLVNFQSGSDTLALDGAAFDLGAAGTLTAGDDRFVVIGTAYDGTLAAGTSARYDAGAGTLIYSTADNTLYHDANGRADGYTVVATVQSGDAPIAGDVTIT